MSLTTRDSEMFTAYRPALVALKSVSHLSNPAEFVSAAQALVRVKQAQKYFDARRKSITAPARAAAKSADELFSTAQTELEAAEADLKRLMGTYVDAAVPLASANAQAALARGDMTALVSSMSAVPAVPGISYSRVQSFEVVDPLLVPRKYLKVEVNRKAVLEAISRGEPVPGIVPIEKTQISVSTGDAS